MPGVERELGVMSTKRRYPTDLTDRQWKLVEPLLPSPPRGPAGRKPKHDKREIINAILYQVRAGGAWRMLPGDLPPWQTVYGYFRDWSADGTLDRVHDALRERVRAKQEKRNPGRPTDHWPPPPPKQLSPPLATTALGNQRPQRSDLAPRPRRRPLATQTAAHTGVNRTV